MNVEIGGTIEERQQALEEQVVLLTRQVMMLQQAMLNMNAAIGELAKPATLIHADGRRLVQ